MKNSKAADSTAAANNILASNNTTTSDILQARIEEAKNFFDLLYSSVKESKYSYLWTLPNKVTYSFDISNTEGRAEMARKAIEVNDSGQNVYFGVCLVDNPLKSNERAKEGKRQPTVQTAIWADIDVAGPTHKSQENKKLAPDFQTAKSLLPFKTSIIVDSGGGLHVYNLLSEPLAITSDNLQSAKARNKNYLETMRTKTKYKVDGVDDLERILRVPGTYNFKAGRDNAPLCHIVEVNDIRYSIDKIDELIQSLISKNDSSGDLGDFVNHTEQPRNTTPKYFDDEPEYENAKIEKALEYIDPAMLSYDEWLNVGKALESVGDNLYLWDSWSKRDPARYHDGECAYKWQSFKGSGITIATLFKFAKDAGYNEKDFRREWHNSNKAAHSYSAETKPNEEAADDSIIGLLKAEKFKEVNALARKTLDEFLAKDEITLDDIYSGNVLYSVGYFVANATVSIEHQLFTKKFREKCKRITQLTGDGGLDKTVERYAEKIQAIADERNRKITELKQQENLDKLRRQAELAAKSRCPLPFDKVILPDNLQMDFANHKTIRLSGENTETTFNAIMLITKVFKNAANSTEKIEIAILKPKDKHFHFFVTERVNIADKNKIVALSTLGVDVTSLNSKEVVSYFKEFEIINDKIIQNIKVFNQIGWRNPDDFIYPVSDSEYQVEYDDVTKNIINTRYEIVGNKEPVINLLKKVKSYDFANVAIGTVLAGSLVYHLKRQCRNIAVHLAAKTESGKSAINLLAYSLIGNPNEKVPTFDSTTVALEEIFAGAHDLCAIVEDLNSATTDKQRKQAENMPYQFVNNTGRSRSKAKGGLREILEYRGSLLTSGERLLTNDTTNAGAKTRVIELCSDENKILPDKLSREIYHTIADNYGLFLHDWIKCIADNKIKMQESFKTFVADWQERFENKSFTHIDGIAAITVANIFFDTHLLGINEDEAIAFETQCAERILENLPERLTIADHERSKSYIRDWVLSNPKKFIQQGNNTNDDTSAHGEAVANEEYGVIRKSFVAVYSSRLKTMLNDEKFNADMVIKQLANDGFILRNGKNIESPVKVNGVLVRMIKIDKTKLIESDNEDGVDIPY